ncbi:MAG: SDR family NAD(P)-dependent oxidoreductase [Candidatus Zixiibacteriota bacterium]
MGDRLKGKSAVVTGAGSPRGIGKEIALALAGEGAKVVVNDIGRDPDGTRGADRVVQEIIKANGIAVANYDGIATMAGGEDVIKAAMNNFGRIDILVNCAGNNVRIPVIDMTEEAWDSIMAVHLKGHFSCSKAAAMEMIKQKSGRIINFSSGTSFHGAAGSLAYATAKAGIMGFNATLSRELKPYGITVNCILPRADTKLFPGEKRSMGDGMPVPLTTEPDFVAPIVVYISTDEAKDITGKYIYAAGGDIAVYAEPFDVTTMHRFVRKIGKWTVDDLEDVIPTLM